MDLNLTAEEMRDWVQKNKRASCAESPDELAAMAHLVGFSWPVICKVLSHYSDALAGSSIHRRSDMFIDLEVKAINRVKAQRDPILKDAWETLDRYQTHGTD